jgi:pyruvate ferredoxin oxidoreductase beta subunit
MEKRADGPVRLSQVAREGEDLLSGGHRLCAGCGAPVVVRQVLLAARMPLVVVGATGCLEVATCFYPYTAWRVPWIHVAFGNAAAVASGVEAAIRHLRREARVVVFAGDGATYDIGLGALSGMLERGHRVLYVCYDNEGYMNTGVQRSGSTPRGADTTTTPGGKEEPRKDLIDIVLAHRVPYAAQTTPAHFSDLMRKVRRALQVEGPSFLSVLAPCPRGWRSETELSMELCRLAVDTCYWPLYEVEEGRVRVNYRPRERRPLSDYLALQGRFRHLFQPKGGEWLRELEREVERRWRELLSREEKNGTGA